MGLKFRGYLYLLLDYFTLLFSWIILHNVCNIISIRGGGGGAGSDLLVFSSMVAYCVFAFICVYF